LKGEEKGNGLPKEHVKPHIGKGGGNVLPRNTSCYLKEQLWQNREWNNPKSPNWRTQKDEKTRFNPGRVLMIRDTMYIFTNGVGT